MKLSESNFEEFQNELTKLTMKKDDKTITLVDHVKGAEGIIKDSFEKFQSYQFQTAVNRTKSILVNNYKLSEALEVTGIVIGATDTILANIPTKMLMIRPGGKHLEITNWDGLKTNDKEGKQVTFTVPCLATMKVTPDTVTKGNRTYNQLVLNMISKYKPIDDKLTLLKTITDPAKRYITDRVDIAKLQPGTGIVFIGKVANIWPAKASFDKEDDSRLPALVNKHPAMTIMLLTEDRISLSINIDPRNKAPFVNYVDDLTPLCQEAVDSTTEPQQQARFLTDALMYTPLLCCGVIRYKQESDGQWNDWTIYVQAHALFDLNDFKIPEQLAKGQTALVTEEEPIEEEKPKRAAKPGRVDADEVKKESHDNSIRIKLIKICKTLNRPLSELTRAQLEKHVLNEDIDMVMAIKEEMEEMEAKQNAEKTEG